MSDRPTDPDNPARDGKTARPGVTEPTSPRRLSSEQLFGRAAEVQIDHRGVLYRLRQTALGKLILTK